MRKKKKEALFANETNGECCQCLLMPSWRRRSIEQQPQPTLGVFFNPSDFYVCLPWGLGFRVSGQCQLLDFQQISPTLVGNCKREGNQLTICTDRRQKKYMCSHLVSLSITCCNIIYNQKSAQILQSNPFASGRKAQQGNIQARARREP